jgi:PAS domain S-box-containing protein
MLQPGPDSPTELAALLAERERREVLVRAERDVLEKIARGAELHDTLTAIVELVEEQTAGALASILLLDDEGHLHVVAAPSLPDSYNRGVEGVAIGPKVGSCGTAAYRKETVVCRDIAHDPLWLDFRDRALSPGLAASWSTPLLGGDGRVLGTLAHYYHTPQDPTPHDLHLSAIARHLAEIAIERKQVDTALERRVEEHTAALRAKEALLRAVVDHTPDMIFVKDLAGRYLLINQAGATAVGLPIAQITGRLVEEVLPAATARTIRESEARVLAEGGVHTIKECLEIGGKERILLVTKFPWLSATGEVLGLVGISRDMTAQLQHERLLTAAQDLAHLGSWEWDVARNEVRWSEELYRIYGQDPASYGATFEAFLACIRADERERVRRGIQEAIASHGAYDMEVHIVRPSGEERALILGGRVDVNEAGKPTRVWGICLDITERKRAEQEVRQLNATLEKRVAERTRQVEAANRELEAFSYSVSHDLRAPLRAIDGFSRILHDEHADQLDAVGREYMCRMRAASQRMGQLIDDMLELSRLTRGALRQDEVDLSAIARAIVDELQAQEPTRAVEVSIAPGLVVEGDARLLRVALENLLNNAWKFTSQHPQAHIAFGREGDTFYVRDDGAGFDMAHASGLFKPFSRLHAPAEFEGTGVGLATVQRVVHRHGGRIWAQAAVERGATFYFTLHEGPSI